MNDLVVVCLACMCLLCNTADEDDDEMIKTNGQNTNNKQHTTRKCSNNWERGKIRCSPNSSTPQHREKWKYCVVRGILVRIACDPLLAVRFRSVYDTIIRPFGSRLSLAFIEISCLAIWCSVCVRVLVCVFVCAQPYADLTACTWLLTFPHIFRVFLSAGSSIVYHFYFCLDFWIKHSHRCPAFWTKESKLTRNDTTIHFTLPWPLLWAFIHCSRVCVFVDKCEWAPCRSVIGDHQCGLFTRAFFAVHSVWCESKSIQNKFSRCKSTGFPIE